MKQYVGEYMFDHWLKNHQKLGGFLASSYVDWDILHSPLHDIVHKLEEFRQVPFDAVMEFSDAGITDNSMEYRDIVEDVSKIISQLIHSSHNGVINLASGKSYSFQQILDFLARILNADIKVKEYERTKAKVDHYYSNKTLKHLVDTKV